MVNNHHFACSKAILFDLDGTLIDTTELILRCFDHTWQAVFQMTHSRDALISTFGIPLPEAMRRLLREGSLQAGSLAALDEGELVTQLLNTYRLFNTENHDQLAEPFAQTQDVVAALSSRQYLTGVVTSKGRELAIRGLQKCRIESLLDVAIFLEDSERHKPHPEPLLVALERLNIAPHDAVYIGDSAHDMIAGRAAGVKTIAAGWGPCPRTDLEQAAPDFIAESLTDLLELFDGCAS